MSANNRTVNHPLFHIRVVGKVLEHSFPYTLVAPASESLVDRIPAAILRRQEPPGGTTTGYPQNAFYETATLFFVLADVSIRIAAQEISYLCPLLILKSHGCHETSLSSLAKCQHYLVKTDCTVDDFQALNWDQRQQWLQLFILQFGLGDWFVDIARVIQVFADDPDYNSMNGWAAYADAAVLQAINDGMRLAGGQKAIGSAGANGGAAWAEFFRKAEQRSIGQNELIILRLAGEQGGVDYATSLQETQRRYSSLSPHVQDKSGFFLAGANTYRTLGMWCHAGCFTHVSLPGELVENLIVAYTDPRTSGDTWLIQKLAQLPDLWGSITQFAREQFQ